MLNLPTNIAKPERVARAVIGAILILGGLVGAGPVFMFIIGVLLIAEAALSFCGIVHVWTMIGQKKTAVPPSSVVPPSSTPPSATPPSATTTSTVSKPFSPPPASPAEDKTTKTTEDKSTKM